MLIMALMMRHKITDIGLNNFLKVLNLHLPEDLYASKYKFLKLFNPVGEKEYYYCQTVTNFSISV